MAGWIGYEQATPVHGAASLLPRVPGKYAFFIDTLGSLPESFRTEAMTRPETLLLYIGKADVSLYQRVWQEECQHRRPGTFFRSVGAMLGYKSPMGGRNYEFAMQDKSAIIGWIARHLMVVWSCDAVAGSHRTGEQELIKGLMPLLNLQGNPRKFAELERLRAICRAGST